MNKNFIKKNKYTIIAIVIFIILVIALANIAKLFFPNTGTPVYGNRLDGINPISDEVLTNLNTKLGEEKIVEEVTSNVSGKILNVTITIDNSTSLSAAKKVGEKTGEYLDDDVKSQYDIQVFVKKKDTAENDFPIIAYKKNTSDKFSWTKDREKVVEEETGDSN